jgi:hypothetical protein
MSKVVNATKLLIVHWWCTPCGQWRTPKHLTHLGPMCPVCGSGRMRPPRQGERITV